MNDIQGKQRDARREAMVERQLVARGIRSGRVLDAMRRTPRELFVRFEDRDRAYDDCALPIEEGQTISQPYVVALMAEALELTGGERVLDVGAGSGYAAAVLANLAERVYAIEYHEHLTRRASERMQQLALDNVFVKHGDGRRGWPEHAPFDAITVAAASERLPEALVDQLRDGGRLVIPLGAQEGGQVLERYRKAGGELQRESLGAVRFVPLLGAHRE